MRVALLWFSIVASVGVFATHPKWALAVSVSHNLLQTRQTLAIPQDIQGRLTGESLAEKDRKVLAIAGLENYLKEIFGTESGDAKLNAWLQQLAKSRFEAYVPSWSVRVIERNEAEVTLMVSLPLLRKDVEKSSFARLISKISPDSASLSNSASSIAAISLLIDEHSGDAFVLPPDSTVGILQRTNEKYHIHPGKFANQANPTDTVLASTETTLAERVGLYTAALQKRLGSAELDFNKTWSAQVINFLQEATGVGQMTRATLWPPPISLGESTLNGEDGFVFVFVVRGSDKSSVLDKVDLMRLRGSRFTRSYWSRNLNDPTQKEPVAKILDKVTTHFIKQYKSVIPKKEDGKIHFVFDKKVSDRDVAKIEAVLRPAALGWDILLVPYEVNKTDIRYTSPVEARKLNKVIARINKEVPSVYARAIPGKSDAIQVIPNTQQ